MAINKHYENSNIAGSLDNSREAYVLVSVESHRNKLNALIRYALKRACFGNTQHTCAVFVRSS